jgi:AraC family transcriptional regulator
MTAPTLERAHRQFAPRPCRSATAEARVRAVRRVIAVMRERYAEGLSLEEMSDIAISSPFHFNRVFREVTGLPPIRFLSAVRLQAAKHLLLTTRRSVTDICFGVGYSSLGTFTAHFAEYVGAPPSRFRQLSRTTGACAPPPFPAPGPNPIRRDGVSIVRGHLRAAPDGASHMLAIIGLFPTWLPRGHPRACTVGRVGEPFVIEAAPPGWHHLFAVAFETPNGDDAALYLGDSVWRGHVGPVLVREGRDVVLGDLELRPPRDTDPPLLIAPPALMAERGRAAALAVISG